MNKKLVFGLILLIGLILFFAPSLKPQPKPSANPAPTSSPKNYEVFEKYSNGSCVANSDCTPAGCNQHICSSDPGLITTCEAISDHPKDSGYSCGCVNQACVWYK